MPRKNDQNKTTAKRLEHRVTMYLFPGVKPEAEIASDRHLYDIECAYCGSEGDCAHLLACIDPENFDVGGRAVGLDREFAARIRTAFEKHLRQETTGLRWAEQDVKELWDWAKENWSAERQEVENDEIVLFRLLTCILEKFAAHAEVGSILEGFGTETEYTCIYDDDPVRVIDEAIQYLDDILKPLSSPPGRA